MDSCLCTICGNVHKCQFSITLPNLTPPSFGRQESGVSVYKQYAIVVIIWFLSMKRPWLKNVTNIFINVLKKQVFTRFGAKCGKMLLLISVCFSLQTVPHSTPCRVFVDVNILFGWWSKILFFNFQNITCAFIALVIHIYWEILNFYFSQDMPIICFRWVMLEYKGFSKYIYFHWKEWECWRRCYNYCWFHSNLDRVPCFREKHEALPCCW